MTFYDFSEFIAQTALLLSCFEITTGIDAEQELPQSVDTGDMHCLQAYTVENGLEACMEIDGIYMIRHPVDDKDVHIKTIAHQRLAALRSWNPHPSSYLIDSYVKSGTHFLWDIMTMMLNHNATVPAIYKEETHLEMNPVTKLEAFPKPTVYNSHMEPDSLPDAVASLKTIFILRNPKDVMVSAYHHHHVRLFSTSWNDHFDLWMDIAKNDGKESWWQFVRQAWRLRDQPNVHIMFYEDLLMNFHDEIRRLADFMGMTIPDSLIEMIHKNTQIDTIRKIREVICDAEHNKYFLPLYRKGKVGGWKEYFTAEQSEQFDRVTDELLQECEGLKFTYDV